MTSKPPLRAMMLIIVSLLAIAAIVALRGQVAGQQSTPPNDYDEQGIVPEVAPTREGGYPAPIQVTPRTGVYAGLSNEEVAQDILNKWKGRQWASDDAEVVRFADVFATDASRMGLQERQILVGSEPDVAVIMRGEFTINLPGLDRVGAKPFAMTVVDRDTGKDYLYLLNDAVEPLLDRLSP